MKADLLSQQFESVFVHDSDQNGTPILPGTDFPNISNLFISEGGLLKLLKWLDIPVSKASGPDQIPNKILRGLAIHLSPIHTSLFNQSLLSENLPSDWKIATVTPVFKKGNRSYARKYRPLSLVCVACITAKTISNALTSSRLDYCNSLLNSIAKQDLSQLKRGQNCLARVVLI